MNLLLSEYSFDLSHRTQSTLFVQFPYPSSFAIYWVFMSNRQIHRRSLGGFEISVFHALLPILTTSIFSVIPRTARNVSYARRNWVNRLPKRLTKRAVSRLPRRHRSIVTLGSKVGRKRIVKAREDKPMLRAYMYTWAEIKRSYSRCTIRRGRGIACRRRRIPLLSRGQLACPVRLSSSW